jgi:hypothetical protein
MVFKRMKKIVQNWYKNSKISNKIMDSMILCHDGDITASKRAYERIVEPV